jgi:putative ABC transport system permease protein
VNATMARRIWGDRDPIGRTIETNSREGVGWEPLRIVGVAADAQLIARGVPVSPYIYVPVAQHYLPQLALLVKTRGGSAVAPIRALIREMNRNLPLTQALPLTDVTAVELIPQRIAASIAGVLGLVGLLLAAIGIYGMTSYTVSRRTREIGIRMALGADRGTVLALVLRQAMGSTAVGVVIGVAGGAAASQLLRSLLFGISAVDPLTFTAAALLFIAIAAAASYGPARRATRVHPMVALRTE